MTVIPLSYNPSGIEISGCTQVGDLAIGSPVSGFTNNPLFWNSPDLDLGYVIAVPVSGNTQPTPISGVTASLGFYRSKELNDESFITIVNKVTKSSFTGITECLDELNTLGYWTSYESPAPVDPLPPLTDVMLYLKYEDNLTDSSLNNFNLINTTPPLYGTDYSPKVGFSEGGYFNSLDNGIRTSEDYMSIITNNNVSISTWLYHIDYLFGSSEVFALNNGFSVSIYQDGGTLTEGLTLNIGFQAFINTQPGSITRDEWEHVVLVVENTEDPITPYQYSIYINGVIQELLDSNFNPIGTTFNTNIDFTSSNGSLSVAKELNGYLDETIFFNTVLTQEQITELYTRETPAYGQPLPPFPSIEDVLVYFQYEDNITDISLNNFTPIVFGAINGYSTDYTPKVGFNKGVNVTSSQIRVQENITVGEKSIFTWVNTQSNMDRTKRIFAIFTDDITVLSFKNTNLVLGNNTTDFLTISGFTNDTWYHLGITSRWDSNTTIETISVYVNGVKVGTHDRVNINFGASTQFIYDVANASLSPLNGYMDETIFYTLSLTDNQVLELYNKTEPAY